METGPLAELLIEKFETMPPRLQVAARYVLEHPEDVALMSMREQSQQAGVSHSTMMRLARWLGFESYEEMRALYARALRDPARSAARDGAAARSDDDGSALSIVGRSADSLAAQVARIGEYASAEQIAAAADGLVAAGQVFALGLRTEYVVAHHFTYTLSLLGMRATLLGGPGHCGPEALRQAGAGDALLAIGLVPYCRATVEIAQLAARRGVTVIAITDSKVSPLARLARASIIVTASSQSLAQSIVPAMAATEMLAALVVARSGVDVETLRKGTEEQLAELGVFWKSA